MFILLHVKVYLISLTEIMLKLIVSSLKIVLRARNLQSFQVIFVSTFLLKNIVSFVRTSVTKLGDF